VTVELTAHDAATEVEVPDWFDERLVADLVRKRSRPRGVFSLLDVIVLHSLGTAFGTKTWRYARKYDWSELEGFIGDDCREILAADFRPDVIVGIKSGGAFIANFVAQQLGVRQVGYVRVERYAPIWGSTCLAFVCKYLRAPRLTVLTDLELAGRKVLLVDDQTLTGKSLTITRRWIEESGASEVRSYCIFTQKFRPDFGNRSGIMLNSPWGDDP
jgi:hypoxanthine phosphoribosyltransferase